MTFDVLSVLVGSFFQGQVVAYWGTDQPHPQPYLICAICIGLFILLVGFVPAIYVSAATRHPPSAKALRSVLYQ